MSEDSDYQNSWFCTEALIEDIETDKKVAIRSLSRPAYAKYASDSYFDTVPCH